MTEMVNIQIPMDVLVRAVQDAGVTDRLHDMIKEHGEITSRNKAMKLLHVGFETLEGLIADGKIRTACEGAFIDVRSVAEYMDRQSARSKGNGRYKL